MGRPKGVKNNKPAPKTWMHPCQKCRLVKRMPINNFRCAKCHKEEERIYEMPVHRVMHDQYKGDFQ